MERSERFAKIERLLRARQGVPLSELRRAVEVSRATLFRDIAYLRDRMGVPIVFDRETSAYRLDPSTDREELPGLWFSAAEIHALLTMQRHLASLDGGGLLEEQLAPLRQRLLGLLESRADSADEIVRRIRVVSAAARTYAPRHFQSLAAALMERRQLHIRYQARSNGVASERLVSPQRLTHYRDNWYLDAWCHLRDELRSFAVDAILAVASLDSVAQEVADRDLDAALGAGYGIFAGAAVQWATLVFTPERARWVASERWHPQQEGEFLSDGSYRLRVPYSNDPELVMDILKYGPDCKVAAPVELRAKVVSLLKDAVGRYADE